MVGRGRRGKVTASDVPRLVVGTGPPGAGKTTIATAVADELEIPLIAKDELKEKLHDSLGGEGREWSQRLGVATFGLIFHVLAELLGNRCSVVAEGNFSQAEPFRALPAARVLQLHVWAPPEVVRQRFAARHRRHPVHYDADVVDEVPARLSAGEWAALEIGGDLVRVDTTTFPDLPELVGRLRRTYDL